VGNFSSTKFEVYGIFSEILSKFEMIVCIEPNKL